MENETRLKVNKKLELETRIFKLRVPYLRILAIYLIVAVAILFMSFSFIKLALLAIVGGVAYAVLKFLDEINFLDRFKKSTIPDYFHNDLY